MDSIRVRRAQPGTSEISTQRRHGMKIMSVVGARPNFMKVGPVIQAITKHNEKAQWAVPVAPRIQHVLVHTGQHYDRRMSDSFFEDLELPVPDYHLGVGSG